MDNGFLSQCQGFESQISTHGELRGTTQSPVKGPLSETARVISEHIKADGNSFEGEARNCLARV